jgi:glucan phosphoethanolaminetransferase (alkaline phosphatase superfamily)
MPGFSSPRDRWFYSGMATLLAGVIFAGFVPTFFARGAFHDLPPLPTAAPSHSLAGTLWLALFVVQAWLVTADRRDWHRRLGVAGAVLAALFVLGAAGVIANLEHRHLYDSVGTLAAHVYANGAPTAAFGVLVAAGISQRRVAARHKRFMLLAAIALLPPGMGRLFGYLGLSFLNVPVYLCVLFFNTLYDVFVHRRVHPVSWIGGVVLAAIEISTDWWLEAIGS